jgi:hypothetical protein
MPVVARGDVDNQAGCHKELRAVNLTYEASARIRPPNSLRGYLQPPSMTFYMK